MNSKVLVAVCLLVVAASAIPQPGAGWPGAVANPWGPPAWPVAGGVGANPWIPPWVASAPWMPQWKPCAAIGATCSDCNTKSVCTPIGGMEKACSDPTMPYCNLGECSATPSAECAPATEAATASA